MKSWLQKFANSIVLFVVAPATCLSGLVTVASAQAPTVVQIPFAGNVAGLAPGSGNVACTNDIPTFKGAHVGDGCLPTQATLNSPYSTAIDAYNNLYIADYNNLLLRVVYRGGTALANAIIAANPAVSGLVPQPGHIYTLAGSLSGSLGKSGSPTPALYCNGAGTGIIALGSNGDGCPGSQSYVKPRSIGLDKDGNVFFSSLANGQTVRVLYVGGTAAANLITKLTPSAIPQVGSVYSIGGLSKGGYSGDGGLGTAAAFLNIRDVVVDANENVYVSDGQITSLTGTTSASNQNVRVVNGSTGIISTFAGSAGCTVPNTTGCTGGNTGDGGPATQATLNGPYGLFVDQYSNLFISDSNNGRLRVVYVGGTVPGLSNPVAGNIYTVAGGGPSGNVGTLQTGIPATQLSISSLTTSGIDGAGNLYVSDSNYKYIWQINAKTGTAVLIAGLGATYVTSPLPAYTPNPAAAAGNYCNAGTSGPKSVDTAGDGCPALQASVSPSGRLVFDSFNNMFEVETGASTAAGTGVVRQFNWSAQFPVTATGSSAAVALAFDVLSVTTFTAEKFSLQGGATAEFSDAGGNTCSLNTALSANALCVFNAQFTPAQAGLRQGSLQMANGSASLVSVYLNGTGQGSNISLDPGTQTKLGSGLASHGIGVDTLGNVFVADSGSSSVVKVAAGGGTPKTLISGLSQPGQVAVDGLGNVYVADTGNNRIVQTPAAGSPITALGSGLKAPQGVAIDGLGNVYVADTGNNRVVEILSVGGQKTLPFTGLNGPSSVALDANGDVFVADTGNSRVVELPLNSNQTVLNLGQTPVTPEGIAVDAAGNVYIADQASLQVLEFLGGTATNDTLLTGLKAPSGVAVDANGSVYVSDSQLTNAIAINRILASIGYPLTNVGQASISPIIVTNTGNSALNFTGSQPTNPSVSGSFSIASASTNGCVVTSPLAPGQDCVLNATFQPTSRGTVAANIAFPTDAANTGSAQAVLTGTGAQLFPTTTALAVTTPASGSITFGQTVVVTATMTPTQSAGTTPTGTVTFSVDGKAQSPQPVGSGVLTLMLNLPVGTHAVSATYSGDTVYASSNGTVSFTVGKATTTTTLSLASSAPSGKPTLTFSSLVSSVTASGTTGTVAIYAGTALIATVPVSPQGVATYTTTNTVYSTYSFTAVYSGDSNFLTSTSTPLQPAGDFLVSYSGATVATAQGGVASLSLTVTPLFNMSGTVTPTCTGLPANSVCRFQPTTMQITANTPTALSILVYTNVPSNIAQLESLPGKGTGTQLPALAAIAFVCPGWVGAGLLLRGRRRTWDKMVLVLVLSLGGMIALGGCNKQSIIPAPATPTGSQTVTVSLAGPSNLTHAVSFTFVVNPN